jgi:hypothetical protein
MKAILIRLAISMIRPELIFSLINLSLTAIESAVKSSSTEWDDKAILPIVEKLKKALA